MVRRNYKDRDIACPFWRGEEENSISCEGLEPGMKTVCCFASKERKAGYAMRRCKNIHGYKLCRVAQALIRKYEEE